MYTSHVHLSLTCVHNLLGRAVQDDVVDGQHEEDSTSTNANHASPDDRCRVVDGEVTEGLHELAQVAATVYSAVLHLAAHASGAVAANEKVLRKFMQAFCNLPIDYATATFRARMVCVRERAVCLVLAIHHVVLDGPSQQIVHTGVCVREMYMCVRA